MYTNIRTQENIFKKSCFVLRGELESILVVYFSIFSLQCLLFLTSDDCTELKKTSNQNWALLLLFLKFDQMKNKKKDRVCAKFIVYCT